MVSGDRMMAVAYHWLGNQIGARHHAERALHAAAAGPSNPRADYSLAISTIEAAAQAVLGRIRGSRDFPESGHSRRPRKAWSAHSQLIIYIVTLIWR